MTQVVLAGGLLCDDRIWSDVQGRLSGASHVVTFDLESTIEAMAQSILALPASRFKLVGYSMGGMAALLAAAEAPERISSLLLVGTHAEPETSERQANRARQIALVDRNGLRNFVETELLPPISAATRRASATRRGWRAWPRRAAANGFAAMCGRCPPGPTLARCCRGSP